MSEDDAAPHPTLALSTKVEEDFVAPLAAVRGALEILRDHSDLGADDRLRFVRTALRGCARLQKGVDELARTVYAAGRRTLSASLDQGAPDQGAPHTGDGRFEDHVRFFDDIDVVEIAFAGLEFRSSGTVNDFFDAVERLVGATGRRWYFLVSYGGYTVWPEAWIAFAHRGKRLSAAFSRGTARYDECADGGAESSREFDPSIFSTRDAALARIERMKAEALPREPDFAP